MFLQSGLLTTVSGPPYRPTRTWWYGLPNDVIAAAVDWAELRSFNDESRFTVHTAAEVIGAFQDGESVK